MVIEQAISDKLEGETYTFIHPSVLLPSLDHDITPLKLYFVSSYQK